MNERVDKKVVLITLAITLVLAAVLIAAVFYFRNAQQDTDPTGTSAVVTGTSYEKWLAAHEYTLVYLLYQPTVEPEFYLASETAMEYKSYSGGVYIRLTLEDRVVLLESKPLEAERTEPGTKDVSAPMIGYATFDEVDPKSVDLSKMEKLSFDELSELNDEVLLPALSEH